MRFACQNTKALDANMYMKYVLPLNGKNV